MLNDYIEVTSPIFKVKPTLLFAEKIGVSPLFWENMFLRYKYLGYSIRDLQEWFELKAGKHISQKTIRRYIVRQELYDDAHTAVKMGARIVTVQYFKRHTEIVKDRYKLDDLLNE